MAVRSRFTDRSGVHRAVRCHTASVPGHVYNPDHTAHIRTRLKQMATWVVSGLVIAAIAAGVVAGIAHGAAEPLPAGLMRAVWIALSFLVALPLLALVLAAVLRGAFRVRRAEPDAQGAEIVEEFKARIANARRDDS